MDREEYASNVANKRVRRQMINDCLWEAQHGRGAMDRKQMALQTAQVLATLEVADELNDVRSLMEVMGGP